ncbi:cell division protein FtsZ [Lebetimonas sp. JH292]|uniref:cell division protein FtsZ n=1 Tax=Lebetimonas sp. JH292 TaxID=990068 RepID=UPI000465B6F4|nr:cell division protein FtsZ [Lebetimonas sp. JH292]
MENATTNLFTIKEEIDGPKIKVIGVGGGGNNMINYMVNKGIKDVELIAANTDIQALKTSKAHKKIQLGVKLTNGLGAGMRPEIGAKAAEESFDEIKESLEGADLVFISAGMGGGTGTGAASIIAKAAKELGALTVGVVTKPFRFEGSRRGKLAEIGTNELKKEANSIVVIPNDKLLTIIDRKVGRREAFSLVDDVLFKAVHGISNMVISYGENDINVDFNDLKTVMSHQGLALMGVGEDKGESAAFNSIKKAIESPLLDNISIEGAMGVLVHFTMHEDYSLDEIYEGMNIIEEKAHDDADIIFGTSTDNSLAPDEIKVTIVATGFEKNDAANKEDIKKNIETMLVGKEKVVGGIELDVDELDIPAYMRRMKD